MKRIGAVIRRAAASLRHDGVRKTLAKFPPLVVDLWFDLRHGVETCGYRSLQDLHIDSENRGSGYNYKATRIVPLRRILKIIHACAPAGSVFVDFGSGKGRALLIAAETGFTTIRGVEFAPELCQIAHQNCAVYKRATGTAASFEIFDLDATLYQVKKEENIFFVANAFNEEILGRVIDNIFLSLQEQPRKIWIIYYNPRHQHLLAKQQFLSAVQRYDLWDDVFHIYHN